MQYFQQKTIGTLSPMLGVGLIYSLLFGMNETFKRLTQNFLNS